MRPFLIDKFCRLFKNNLVGRSLKKADTESMLLRKSLLIAKRPAAAERFLLE